MFSLKISQVVGVPTSSAWSQVHLFRGELLVVLSLTGLEDKTGLEIGREVLGRLNEEYFGNLTLATPFLALKETLTKVSQESSAEITAAVLCREALYLGLVGKGKILLLRGQTLEPILKPGAEEETSLKTASGIIKEGDLFLLGTGDFFSIVAEGTLRASLKTGEPEEAVEILAPLVAGREEVGGVAAVIAKVVKEEEPSRDLEPEPASESLAAKKSLISFLRRLISFRRPLFIRRQPRLAQNRTFVSVAAVLIFLLLTSVLFGMRKKEEEKRTKEADQIYQAAQAKFEEGKALVNFQPAKAQELLNQAADLVREGEKSKVLNSKFQILNEEIEKEKTGLITEYRLEELPLFFDLNLVKEGAKGERMAQTGNNLIILDKEGKRLLGLELEKKSARIFAGGENLGGATQIAVWDDKVYVLAEKEISQITYPIPHTTYHIPSNDSWSEIADLKTFGGNLYLLDKQKQTIWRYSPTQTGFGTPRSWLATPNPSLADAVSFAVDGSIWVLLERGPTPLVKFTAGRQENFSFTDLEKPLASPTRIYTDKDSQFLYILDKGNYRIAVFDKEGAYHSSYLWAGIADVTDLAVSEENKKIFLLAKNKIYEIGIGK